MRASRWTAIQFAIAATLLTIVLPARVRAADKTDVVVLENGDRLTGDIKRLEGGKLELKTNAMSTVYIEWDKVATVASKWRFEARLASGLRFFGSLASSPDGTQVVIVADPQPIAVPSYEIVRLAPIEAGFWASLDGSASGGYSFTQANERTQWTFSADVGQRRRNSRSLITFNSLYSSQEEAATTIRNDVAAAFNRFVSTSYFIVIAGQGQENRELDLDFRVVGIGGAGKDVVERPIGRLSVFGGLAYAREKFTSQAQRNSSEAVGGLQAAIYRFAGLDTEISVAFTAFPSISDAGRVRLELNVGVKKEIVSKLYLSLSLFDSYDSRPPDEAIKKNDFGVSSGLGWSF
jgi:uncharacterized protein DUF481